MIADVVAADPRARVALTTLRLNARLFRNCLHGVSDADSLRRPDARTNHLAFVAAHVVEARHALARELGLDVGAPFDGRLADARAIDDVASCPTLAESLAAWDALAAPLAERVAAAPAGLLDAPASARYPVDDATVLGALAFLLQHESYHIGQMALLRKHATGTPMKY
jgi:uncharacterized damage-inducible protein DinB